MTTLPNNYRDAACNGVVDRLDSGAGSNATLQIATDGTFSTILLTFDLDATAFGDSASGTASASSLPKTATATGTGDAGAYRYRDKDNALGPSGTDVGTSGNEVVISPSVSVTSGDDYDLTSATFTMPAS